MIFIYFQREVEYVVIFLIDGAKESFCCYEVTQYRCEVDKAQTRIRLAHQCTDPQNRRSDKAQPCGNLLSISCMQLAPQFPRTNCLILPRCLKSPLDSLSIISCWLIESDLTHLSQRPDISQLKSLDLSGVTMTDFRPELLQVLLEKVAATMQELDFDVCGITDSQLEAFLPALSLCSQLRSFSLCGNLLSMAGVEKLLRHTAVLPCLRQERYPAPQETCRPRGVLLEARLAQLRAQLLEILRDLGRPRIIWISLNPCPHCGEAVCHHMEPIIYS